MSYLALYREWRPRRFADMTGQEHVRRTLVNALLRDKVAHAYLFSGPRGTGKTTAAKILAKAMNCGARQGAEPCNECLSCREIDQGVSLDVYEIDAASNRGIDEIRDLREKVRLAPAGGRYKVYIIDEVHMLTKEAFNALLKTLEEPPAGVVFVLATTEAHKVPLTILSRVQRFSFHRLTDREIAARLAEVCRAGGREVGENVLALIAAKAEGSLRDALSLLDQCLLVEGELLPEHVYGILGAAGEEYIADLTEDLLKRDYAAVLQRLTEGVALGRDPRQLIRELLEYLRRLLLYLAGGEQPLLSEEQAARLRLQAAATDLPRLLAMLESIMKGDAELRYASNARLAADMILLEAMGAAPPAAETPSARPAPRIARGEAGSAAPAVSRAPASAVSGPAAPSAPAAAPASAAPTLETVQGLWPKLLDEVRGKKRSTHALLLEGSPAAWRDGVLYLAFPDGNVFHKGKFTQAENKNIVEEILSRLLGQPAALQSVLKSELAGPAAGEPGSAPAGDAPKESALSEQTRRMQDLFGEDIVRTTDET
ncbi:MAG: DNA polymerase III subunit gamma/tau [Gracilibacteraceae bacterium]|jgi:DNA polymerase-3 subunit gamma/tau|nr:DNA polymerase III subunit gamma/tau [Gracilibacteraceae bacterium]